MGNTYSNMGNTDSSIMNEQSKPGTLHIYIGPMYAGKTSKLIDTYEQSLQNEENSIILTHSSEVRYSIDQLSTHDQKKVSCFKYDNIQKFMNEQAETIDKCSTVLIDEAQFFPELKDVLYLVNVLHKDVYIFGLDGDFQRNKFGDILDLIPHCDSVEKLTANCNNCDSPAIFSHRTCVSDEQVLVGSHDSYRPLCRKCYNRCLRNP